jgi:hypothetical protein
MYPQVLLPSKSRLPLASHTLGVPEGMGIAHPAHARHPVGIVIDVVHRAKLCGLAQAVAYRIISVVEVGAIRVIGARQPPQRVVGVGNIQPHQLVRGYRHWQAQVGYGLVQAGQLSPGVWPGLAHQLGQAVRVVGCQHQGVLALQRHGQRCSNVAGTVAVEGVHELRPACPGVDPSMQEGEYEQVLALGELLAEPNPSL